MSEFERQIYTDLKDVYKRQVVGQRGYFPADMPVKDYPMDFVDGCLVAAWDQVAQMIVNNRDVPF